MAKVWGVNSYHININVGDSAIHILYSRPANDLGTKTVESAVLIDGGKDGSGGWKPESLTSASPNKNIYSTIKDIEDEMVCQDTRGGGGWLGNRRRLQFNAIVVTHWDADHSDGLMGFLRDDILTEYGTGNYPDPGKTRLRCAIYKDNQPQTIFYAPYWRDYYAEGLTQSNKDYWPYSRYKFMFISSYELEDSKNGAANMHIRIDKDHWAIDVLRMRIGTHALLGANFFNMNVSDKHLGDRKDVFSLLIANPPGGPDKPAMMPGLYCVAVNQRVIGTVPPPQPITDGIKTGDPVLPQTTYKNKSSICNLVIWSDSSISHYLAGDADLELEKRILNWTGWSDNPQAQKGIVVAKLSHHGASSSNPKELFTKLKPQHVVISAGDNKGYGHPREYYFLLHICELMHIFLIDSSVSVLILCTHPYVLP